MKFDTKSISFFILAEILLTAAFISSMIICAREGQTDKTASISSVCTYNDITWVLTALTIIVAVIWLFKYDSSTIAIITGVIALCILCTMKEDDLASTLHYFFVITALITVGISFVLNKEYIWFVAYCIFIGLFFLFSILKINYMTIITEFILTTLILIECFFIVT